MATTAIGPLAVHPAIKHARVENALRASEQRYRALYDDSPCLYIAVDARGVIRSVNRFAAQRLGYQAGELDGAHLSVLHPRDEGASVRQRIAACLRKAGGVHAWEARAVRKDGSSLWIRVTARAVPGAEEGRSLLLVAEDITEARDLAARLSHRATHDALTGLANRRGFEQRLRRVLETARREDTANALCYVDLDQFRVINDTCGHAAGDQMLRQVAELLGAQVRKRDTLARLGGDEFGILLERCSLARARKVADALRSAVGDFRFHSGGKVCRVAASVGVVPVTAASGSLADVLSAAGTACHAAKEHGCDCVQIYRDGDPELARRRGEMQWVSEIYQALDEGRFRLYAQPIVPVRAAHPGGARERETAPPRGGHHELLLRMQDERGRLVPPGVFLPVAERYNLAARVDRWVVRSALERLAGDPRHLAALECCAVNLSAQSLVDEGFLRFVVSTFEATGVPPRKICFEVTETAVVSNMADAVRLIEALRALGCRFALDDFGSGMSSFAYLKHLPVDLLKIDGLFVESIDSDPINLALVRSMNDIAHLMGKQTIAEFVENRSVLDKLREIGVDYAQGYGIGRPRPLEEHLSAPAGLAAAAGGGTHANATRHRAAG